MYRFQLSNFELLHDIINSASTVFKEIKINFQPEKFSIHAFDETMTCFINCELQPSFFKDYHCDEEAKVCVFLSQLLKILKSTSVEGELYVSLIDNNFFDIKLIHEYEKNYKLVTIDYDKESENGFPIIDNDLILYMNSNSFLEIIKSVQLISDYISLETHDNTLKISGEGIYGQVNIKINKDTPFVDEFIVNNPINNQYDVQWLYDLVRTSSTSFEFCMLTIQNNGPINITYNIFELGTLSIFLAPMR